jgi:C-3',4' desaturase CrtD
MYDVAILGGGMAGMATAARLQAQGLSTVVFEAHGQPGGCAGFFRRSGFAFDVGATTLVDFEPGGVGGELLGSIGMPALAGELLPGYRAWLPDRVVTLHRDSRLWAKERLQALGDSPAHRRFWELIDRLAQVFWKASRAGIKLPIQSPGDFVRAVRTVATRDWPLVRYLRWTVGDALRHFRLRHDEALAGLLGMLLQDTVHARVDDAPLINGALGITIRGAGLTRARGGMYGFWQRFTAHYRALGGRLITGCPVKRAHATGTEKQKTLCGFTIETRRHTFVARQVVSALPASLTIRLAPAAVGQSLESFVKRDADAMGGAVVVFLGVPEYEVGGQTFTHHQLMHDYRSPLRNGNNLFISVSSADDTVSAPPGFRTVMISTHCELSEWEGLSAEAYEIQKERIGARLLDLARRVYPGLGRQAVVREVATPRTFECFTRRPRGAVGGVRQTLRNTNQQAIPHATQVPGFWLAGDTTWPGLGTVACVLGSRLVAEGVLDLARRRRPIQVPSPPLLVRKANHESVVH